MKVLLFFLFINLYSVRFFSEESQKNQRMILYSKVFGEFAKEEFFLGFLDCKEIVALSQVNREIREYCLGILNVFSRRYPIFPLRNFTPIASMLYFTLIKPVENIETQAFLGCFGLKICISKSPWAGEKDIENPIICFHDISYFFCLLNSYNPPCYNYSGTKSFMVALEPFTSTDRKSDWMEIQKKLRDIENSSSAPKDKGPIYLLLRQIELLIALSLKTEALMFLDHICKFNNLSNDDIMEIIDFLIKLNEDSRVLAFAKKINIKNDYKFNTEVESIFRKIKPLGEQEDFLLRVVSDPELKNFDQMRIATLISLFSKVTIEKALKCFLILKQHLIDFLVCFKTAEVLLEIYLKNPLTEAAQALKNEIISLIFDKVIRNVVEFDVAEFQSVLSKHGLTILISNTFKEHSYYRTIDFDQVIAIAILLSKLGLEELACKILIRKKFEKSSSEYVRYFFEGVRILIESQKNNEAITFITENLLEIKHHRLYLTRAAEILIELGAFEQALSFLNKITSKEPCYVLHAVKLLLKLNERERALQLLLRINNSSELLESYYEMSRYDNENKKIIQGLLNISDDSFIAPANNNCSDLTKFQLKIMNIRFLFLRVNVEVAKILLDLGEKDKAIKLLEIIFTKFNLRDYYFILKCLHYLRGEKMDDFHKYNGASDETLINGINNVCRWIDPTKAFILKESKASIDCLIEAIECFVKLGQNNQANRLIDYLVEQNAIDENNHFRIKNIFQEMIEGISNRQKAIEAMVAKTKSDQLSLSDQPSAS